MFLKDCVRHAPLNTRPTQRPDDVTPNFLVMFHHFWHSILSDQRASVPTDTPSIRSYSLMTTWTKSSERQNFHSLQQLLSNFFQFTFCIKKWTPIININNLTVFFCWPWNIRHDVHPSPIASGAPDEIAGVSSFAVSFLTGRCCDCIRRYIEVCNLIIHVALKEYEHAKSKNKPKEAWGSFNWLSYEIESFCFSYFRVHAKSSVQHLAQSPLKPISSSIHLTASL